MIIASHFFVLPHEAKSIVFPKLICRKSFIQSSTRKVSFLLLKTATRRNTREMAALKRENHEEHRRRSQAQDNIVPRLQKDYFTQVSEQIEGRLTKESP